MTYREELTRANAALAADPATIFIGYGLRTGRALGTLRDVSADQILETPVAENLMAGLATGLSLAGRKPVVFFERFDFVLNAADAIVNHLGAMADLSQGEFKPAAILRCVVGNKKKPLFTGRTHTQDFSRAFANMVDFPVVRLVVPEQIAGVYEAARRAQDRGESTMIVEFKDLI